MKPTKTACVTGAARGIGLAIARALAGRGHAVIVADVRDDADGRAVAAALPGSGHRYVRADVSSPEGREALAAAVIAAGPLDIHVNNAGVAPLVRADILETGEESYDRVMGINLRGPFFLTQRIARHMVACAAADPSRRAAIVNISSMSADTSSPSRAEYCISKAGVSMMTILFADRLARHGINVYEIRPGIIKTPMTEVVTAKYDKLINEDGILPIRRWGAPEDVAAAVAAIADGALPYSTGQVIDVDGGFHIRRL